MALIGWVDPETISPEEWADVPADAAVLASLLGAAHEHCTEFLPDPATTPYPVPVPARWRLAQILQARALQRSAVAGGNDQIGSEFPVTVFPMDWTVKNLLRAKRGRPAIA